jgi:hypothetical protein
MTILGFKLGCGILKRTRNHGGPRLEQRVCVPANPKDSGAKFLRFPEDDFVKVPCRASGSRAKPSDR